MTRAATLIAAALFAAGSVQASAEERPVAYADLNLSSPADQAVLDRRIAAAAREVCNAYPRSGSLLVPADAQACYRSAVAAAQVQVATAIERHSAATLALRAR